MIESASAWIYEVSGRPPVEGCVDVGEARCWMCAASTLRGMDRESWQGSLFTGQNKVRAPESLVVCEACIFVCARSSPVPGKPATGTKVDKAGNVVDKAPPNFRNFSHLVERGPDGRLVHIAASKGEKPLIREFLARRHAGPWMAAIADSGQKHVIPWTPINPGGPGRGRVLFDEQLVALGDVSLVDDMTALLSKGVTKEEIAAGDYGYLSWRHCGADVSRFEEERSGLRRSAWFDLALWLAQRDEEKVEAEFARRKEESGGTSGRKKPSRRSHSARAAGVSPGGGEPAQALGPDPRPSEGGSAGVGGAGGDDHAPTPGAAPGISEHAVFALTPPAGGGGRSRAARPKRAPRARGA
jgi:hypothetical protein